MQLAILKRSAAAVLSLALLGCLNVAAASSFSLTPSSGALTGAPGDTVGWGYSITNDSGLFLVPTGFTDTGVTFGALDDIFDYPVVAPGSTVSLDYLYAAPGGAGFSTGLLEYQIPVGTPDGLIQSGLLTLSYQLFDSDPDLGGANAVGGIASFDSVPYSVTTAETSAVPEPSSGLFTAFALSAAFALKGWRVRRQTH